MKNGFKRMVAVVLTLLLVMQCAPLNAFAEVPGEEDLLEVPVVVSTDTDTDSELAERPMDDEDVEISEEISDLDVPVVLDDSSEEDEEEEVDTEVTVEEPADKNDEEVPVSMFALFALEPQAVPVLKDGSAVIPSGADLETVKEILADTLISNNDQVDASSVEWEYYCTGKTPTGLKSKDDWVSISGISIKDGIYTYKFPALEDNADGAYQVRIAGTTAEVTLTKKAKNDGSITVNEDCSVAIPYKEDGSADYDALRQKLFDEVVASTTPALTYDNVTIEYEATSNLGNKKYVPLEGRNLYPAISAGDQKIKFSWAGNDAYYGFEQEVSVTLTERSTANLVLKAGQNVALTYKADGTVDYSALKNAIFAAVFDAESSIPALNAEDVSIEYYYKGLTSVGSKWVPLAGGKVDYVDYDGMTIGNDQKIRVSFSGNANFSAASAETTVNIVEGRSVCTIVISDGNLNIRDLSVDGILKAIVTKSDVELTSANASVEYYDEGGLGGYGAGWKTLESLSEGTFKIRVVFAGNEAYLSAVSNEAEIRFVTKEDAEISLNEAPYSVALPYNEAVEIDFDNLKDAIFQTVVASTDPEVTAEDVTFLYYTAPTTGSAGDLGKKWVKLEGDKDTVLTYPAISAGEHQIKFSWAGNDAYYGFEQEVTVTLTDRTTAPYTIKETIDPVTLPVDDDLNVDYKTLAASIFDAVIESSEVLTAENVTIEYEATSAITTKAWVPLNGGTKNAVSYPAISAGEQKIHIIYAGDQQYHRTIVEAVVTVADRDQAPYTLNDPIGSVTLVVDDDLNVDYAAVEKAVFHAVIAHSDVLTDENVTIEYQYNGITGSKWLPLEGQEIALGQGYPAISVGEQKIRIIYAGDQQYNRTIVEAFVTIADRDQAPYTLNDPIGSVTLVVDDDLNVDYAAVEKAVFRAVIAHSDVLTDENVTIEYYYKGITGFDPKWLPLEGQEILLGQGYPAISAGEQKIRISWAGSKEYAPTVVEATVNVKDLPAVDFILNEGPYEIGLVFADVDSFDYEATAEAIYNAVVASTENPEGLTAADVKVEYNTDKTGVTNSYKDLSETDITGLVKFGAGKWKIRISWPGTKEFKGGSVIVDVTMSDNRLESSVVLAEDVSFTYNMDVNVMKQAIFDSVIDWENSALPAKETLTLDDFVILYQASLRDIETGTSLPELPNIPGLPDMGENDMLTQWVPIEGKVYEVAGKVLGQYPQMGAGQQKIRVTFVGNSEYRPSETAEGTVTVNKASVSVKVKTMSMYVDETLPSDFITTNPADKFDIYTISAGITSNVTTAVYLNLPSRYQNPVFLKILDPIVENLYGKSFTQMMNDGITLGELRQLLSTQELLDMLDKLNIDTGTFGQILSAINKLPAITDSVRVSFGFPNRAGMYMVTAVTDNKNYNTGVGTGILVVKMRLIGTKLTWNQTMPGNKLTAAQAAEFDFGATLSYNGDVSIDQSGVHYLYSGVTSKWKSYSSTTTPPTEPGRYVVTVCIIGGNHFASPLTRSFQITK